MKSKIAQYFVFIIAGFVFFAGFFVAMPAEAATVEGMLVVDNAGTVYLIENGQRRPFPTADVFFSHGYNFFQLNDATADDLALPAGPVMIYADGTLVLAQDGTVYLIANGQKRGFTSAEVFFGLGYSFVNLVDDLSANILAYHSEGIIIDSAEMAHPAGTLILSGRTVYQVTTSGGNSGSNGKKGIPTLEIFQSHGFLFQRVVKANSYDLNLPDLGNLSARVVPMRGTTVGPRPPSGPRAPSAPVITGPTEVVVNKSYDYNIVSTDPDGDLIYYTINWGDGTKSEPSALSGQAVGPSQTWSSPGVYTVIVTAADEYENYSESALTVNVAQAPATPPPVSPAVSLTVSADSVAKNVTVGSANVTFVNFVVDATGSVEDLRINRFNLVHTVSQAGIQSNVANLRFFVDGSTALSSIIQPSGTTSVAGYAFNFSSPIMVPKGASKTLSLRGDLVAGTNGQTHRFDCSDFIGTDLTASPSGSKVALTVKNCTGPVITVGTTGTLTVSTDASTPRSGLVVGGAQKVTMLELDFRAETEAMDLREIQIITTSLNGGTLNDEFTAVYLFDGAAQVAALFPTSSSAITFSNLDGKFRIPAGGSKKLTVKVDVAEVANPSIPSAATADSGQGLSFRVNEDSYSAIGVSSGTSISNVQKSGSAVGSEFTVYKSVPTFQRVALSSSLVNGTQSLYQFRVSADPKGDIGFYKAAFEIAASDAAVGNYELYEEYGTSNQVNLTVAGPLRAANDGILSVLFTNTINVSQGNPGVFRIIAAGTAKSYTLRGTVANVTGSSRIATTMLGDSVFAWIYPSTADNATANGNFIWSDLSLGTNPATAANLVQWFNGYRVPGLPTRTDAQVLTGNTAVATQSVTVISPNGGETYQVGQQVKIQWKTKGIAYNASTQVDIMDNRITDWIASSLFGSSPALNYASLVASNGDEYTYEHTFTVPANFNSSLPSQYQGIFGGNNYKVKVNVLVGGTAGTSSQQVKSDLSDTNFNIAIQAPLTIITPILPDATVGQPYSYQLQASGGTAPYSWSSISTTYPTNCCILGIGTNGSFTTQTASTVSSAYTGTYSWVIEVRDANGVTATKTLNLKINPAASVGYRYIKVQSSSNSWVAWHDIEAYDSSGNLLTPVRCDTSGNYLSSCTAVYPGGPSYWNAGDWNGWISLDYGSNKSIKEIKLKPSNSPNPATGTHEIFGMADVETGSGYVSLKIFTGQYYDQQWLSYQLPAVQGAVTANRAPSTPTISQTGQTISGYSTDADGDAITYRVNWGDGSAEETLRLGSGYVYIFSHAWKTGTYLVAVTADDSRGGLSSAGILVSVP